MNINRSRMVTLAAVVGAVTALAVSSCTSSGSGASATGSGSRSASTVLWTPQEDIASLTKAQVDRFNGTSAAKINFNEVTFTGYQDKLRTAMGSSQMPGIFYNWGGGSIKDYVQANLLVDLGPAMAADPQLKDAFLPSVLDVGKIDGKYYGVPFRGTQPVFIFYNKAIFRDAGVEPPKTWEDLLNRVNVFKSKGVIPFSLGGQAAWTLLMWPEYLADRVGGPSVFQKIADGDWHGGWSDPTMLKSAEMIRALVDAGAFGDNFGSVAYGSGGSSSLLSSGKAAMELMGSWEYSTLLADSPDFVKNDLGWIEFPSIAGGQGDPADIVGNPTNYWSISTSANADAAYAFMKDMYSDQYVESLIAAGAVPVTTNARDKLNKAPDPVFATWQYDLVKNAPHFTQSWDQAIDQSLAAPMLTEMQKLFNKQSTPQQYIDAMIALKK